MAEPTAKQRKAFARMGIAMPDGSYYIRDAGELQDAIHAVGRATPNAGESEEARRNAVRRHIMKRAASLKLTSMIPDTWNPDGSLKQPAATHAAAGEAFVLQHFGRKGMKWGEHVFGRDHGSGSTMTVHPDVARARAAQETIQRHGLSAVSNNELRDLNKRTQLESDYARLNVHQSEGKKFVTSFAKESGRSLASGYVQRYGPKGIEWLIKNGIKIAVGSGKHKA